MSFNEPDLVIATRTTPGWRRLERPRRVRCYVASVWADADAVDVNDATREICVQFDTSIHGTRRFILDASLYEPTPALFP